MLWTIKSFFQTCDNSLRELTSTEVLSMHLWFQENELERYLAYYWKSKKLREIINQRTPDDTDVHDEIYADRRAKIRAYCEKNLYPRINDKGAHDKSVDYYVEIVKNWCKSLIQSEEELALTLRYLNELQRQFISFQRVYFHTFSAFIEYREMIKKQDPIKAEELKKAMMIILQESKEAHAFADDEQYRDMNHEAVTDEEASVEDDYSCIQGVQERLLDNLFAFIEDHSSSEERDLKHEYVQKVLEPIGQAKVLNNDFFRSYLSVIRANEGEKSDIEKLWMSKTFDERVAAFNKLGISQSHLQIWDTYLSGQHDPSLKTLFEIITCMIEKGISIESDEVYAQSLPATQAYIQNLKDLAIECIKANHYVELTCDDPKISDAIIEQILSLTKVCLCQDESLSAVLTSKSFHEALAKKKGKKRVLNILAYEFAENDYIESLRAISPYVNLHRIYDEGEGDSLLNIAAENGSYRVCQYLIERGVDREYIGANGFTPLLGAIANQYTDLSRYLFSLGALGYCGKREEPTITALQLASISNSKKMMEIVLKEQKKEDLDIKTIEGQRALTYAIKSGCHLSIAMLLEAGSKAEQIGFEEHPLILAVEKKDTKSVQLLLNYGANIDAIGIDKKTSLMRACELGYSAMVEILLLNHPNIYQEDKEGRTALSYALFNNHQRVIDLLDQEDGKRRIRSGRPHKTALSFLKEYSTQRQVEPHSKRQKI